MNRIRVYGLTCVLSIVALAASATTIVMPTDEQLIAKSPVVVEGNVVATNTIDRNGAIWTEATISVARMIKGETPDTITVAQAGGELDDRITKIYGAPAFAQGERVLLFLEPFERGQYRTVDLFVGKFSEGRTADGRRLWLRNDAEEHVRMLDAEFRMLEPRNMQREAAGFVTFVIERNEGRAGTKSYEIENPILAPKTVRDRAISAEFTLISEPTLYRWFMFDNGGTAQWYSHGTQPGYTNGGLGELTTAMNSWTSYTAAKIRYAYAGGASGSPAGLNSRNSVNEILLNDPLNEISGAWNRSTGGVVGQGGFNGVTSGGTWTAPFAADASHPAGPIRAYNIVEGNLTIQDGVSPNAGISSNRLAEIISHEFGHTLGFGHSTDSTALMYATVTGLGPQLRDDDKVAARWLYPNGTVTEPNPQPATRPSAPTNLTASVSGTTASLQWSDNATNETGYAVYLAAGTTSTFSKVADLGVNARSTSLSGFSTGTHRAYVVAVNSAGDSNPSNTATFSVTINVSASFSFTPQTGTAGTTNFTFYDESTGPVQSRTWNFGDGATSTAAVATHVYARSGQYTVTLTVNGGGTQSTTTRTVNVGGALNAQFTFSPSSPTTNDTISFTDQTSGAITAWYWTFGDGTSSSQQHPSKRYTQSGSYTVTLTVARNSESHAVQKTVNVTAPAPAQPAVNAAFDTSTTTPSAGTSVAFTDRSTGAPTRWSWNFGDGTTSTLQNPSKSYADAGTYTVTLTASNATSQSIATRAITVAQQATSFRSLISVTAQTNGVGGTTWRTELSVFNAGAGTNVDLVFIPGAGGALLTRSVYLGARQSVTYANALRDLFNIESGAGALAIEASSFASTPDLKISSRTFTNATVGTYGQAVPDVTSEVLERTLYLTGIQSNASYRTNVGIVNRSSSPVATTLTLFDMGGNAVATANVTVPANNFQQSSLAAIFPALGTRAFDVLSLRASSAAGNAISVYASVVDNRTQDPIYIQAVPAPVGSSLTLPVVGRAAGANGTYWRSDVTLFNPHGARVVANMRFGASSSSFAIEAGDTAVLADVLQQLGMSSGSGALEVTWNGGNGPVVTSRTYTSVVTGGTYGQSIDPVGSWDRDVFVPGLRSDSSYRSNVGFVNGGNETIGVSVKLLSPQGVELASNHVTLAPKSQLQSSIAALFPGFSGNFTMHAHTDNAATLFAYGSMVDNVSGDPVFFAGR